VEEPAHRRGTVENQGLDHD
jgi:hypothetical protein